MNYSRRIEDMENNEKLTMSVAEVSVALGLSRPTVYSLIHQKRLPAVRISDKRIVVPRAALAKFLEVEVLQPTAAITG